MKRKNWKIVGSLLLCAALSITMIVSGILVYAEDRSEESAEPESESKAAGLQEITESESTAVVEESQFTFSLPEERYFSWDCLRGGVPVYAGAYPDELDRLMNSMALQTMVVRLPFVDHFGLSFVRARAADQETYLISVTVGVEALESEPSFDLHEVKIYTQERFCVHALDEMETARWEALLRTLGLPVEVVDAVQNGYRLLLSEADMWQLAEVAAGNGFYCWSTVGERSNRECSDPESNVHREYHADPERIGALDKYMFNKWLTDCRWRGTDFVFVGVKTMDGVEIQDDSPCKAFTPFERFLINLGDVRHYFRCVKCTFSCLDECPDGCLKVKDCPDAFLKEDIYIVRISEFDFSDLQEKARQQGWELRICTLL